MRAKDSSCRAPAARSWATGFIPARGSIVALFATAPPIYTQNVHLPKSSLEHWTGIAFTGNMSDSYQRAYNFATAPG
jgi:hypothetical protein